MAFIQEGCITAARLHRANSIFNCSGRLSQMIRCTFFFLFDSERTVLTTAPTTRTGCQYPDPWSDQGFMRERGLSLSPTKTKITHIAKGFDFLGQNIRKYDGYWIKQRYFHCTGGRMWVFAAATGAYWPDGKAVVTTLRLAADVPIRRHIKIKAKAVEDCLKLPHCFHRNLPHPVNA